MFIPSRRKVVRRFKFVKKHLTQEFKTYIEERFDNEEDSDNDDDSDSEYENEYTDITEEYADIDVNMTVDEASII